MDLQVVDNSNHSRFEIHADGELAGFADYRLQSERIELLHTEIDSGFGGHGLGSQLVRAALDSARDHGLGVLPHCSFVHGWIANHPDYTELVPEDRRTEFGL